MNILSVILASTLMCTTVHPVCILLSLQVLLEASLDFNRHTFALIDTDEYVLRYMERHCHQVKINLGSVLGPFMAS